MAEKSNIAWTDSTLNFWEGCTKVSAGCQHCYAEARDKRFTGGKLWGKGAPRRKSKSAVRDAFKFNRLSHICDVCGVAMTKETADGYTSQGHKHLYAGDCERGSCGGKFHARRIFSLSLGDWLDDEVPIEWLAEMLDTIRKCGNVTWILCTKRPENWGKLIRAAIQWNEESKMGGKNEWLSRWLSGQAPANIILLASVENQVTADKRIPELLKIPATYHGLSLEPLLGPVDLKFRLTESTGGDVIRGIDWLIIGGESGDKARPCNVEWIHSLVEQGRAAGVATFVKQFGTKSIWVRDGDDYEHALKDKKGGDIKEWPENLRIQEFVL